MEARVRIIGALAACVLAAAPAGGIAQPLPCEGLTPDTRVRLSVPERQWSGVVSTVVGCTDTELVVKRSPEDTVRLPWPAIARAERSERWDLRWPLFVAGAAAGLWLGTQLPVEKEEDCDINDDFEYDCFDRGQAMFLGLTIVGVPAYFGGMFIKIDRWELIPLYGSRTGVLAKVSF